MRLHLLPNVSATRLQAIKRGQAARKEVEAKEAQAKEASEQCARFKKKSAEVKEELQGMKQRLEEREVELRKHRNKQRKSESGVQAEISRLPFPYGALRNCQHTNTQTPRHQHQAVPERDGTAGA